MADKETPSAASGNNANGASAQNNNAPSSFANDPVISRLINANRHLYGETQAEKAQRASGNISPQQQAYIQSVKDQKNTNRYNEIVNYLNSGEMTSEQTMSYLEEAMNFSNGDNGYELVDYDEKTGTAKYSNRSWSSIWGDLANTLERYAVVDYITTGAHDEETTAKWFERANSHVANAPGAGVENDWGIISNALYYLGFNDNRAQYEDLSKEADSINETLAKLKATRDNSAKSASMGMQPGNFLGSYSETLKQIQENEAALEEIQAQQSALDELIIQQYAPESVKADYEALKSGKLHGVELPSLVGEANPGEAAQARVDEWMQQFGLNAAYFNRHDRAVGGARSAGNSIAGGLTGAASLIGKALDSADMSDMNVMGAASFTGSTQKNKEDREARKERIGLPEGQATEEYLAWYNSESARLNDPKYAFDTPEAQLQQEREAFEAENIRRLEALLQPELDVIGKRISYLKTRVENNSKAPDAIVTGESLTAVQQAQQDAATLRTLKKQQQDMMDRLLEAQGLRDKTSLRYKLATDYQRDIFAKMDANVDLLDKQSQLELLKSKERATSYGKILLDIEKTGLEMGFDTVVGLMTGGTMLPSMFVRVLGNESAAARRGGATLEQQLKYGLTKAAIEVATEKMFGMFTKIGAGRGAIDQMFNFSERLVKRLADTSAGRTFVRLLLAAVEEGTEEGLADIFAPLAHLISGYDSDTLKNLFTRETENFWYDVFLGSALGILGVGGAIATGQNTEANLRLYAQELQSDVDKVNQLAEERANAPRVGFADRVAQARGDQNTATHEAVKEHFAEQINKEVPKTKATQVYEKIQRIREQILNGEPVTETLTREETSIAKGMGLLDKTTAKLLLGPTKQQKSKAERKADKSRNNVDIVRDKIIDRAQELGVGQKEAEARPWKPRVDEAPEHEPNAGGSAEYEAELAARAAEGQKAIDEGKTDNKNLASVVRLVDATVKSGKTLKAIKENIFKKTGKEGEPSLLDKVSNWMEKTIGGRVYTKKIGGENGADIILNRRGIKNDIAHGVGEEKAATFQAVPDVLRNGQIVSTTKKNGEPVSYIIAGKVNLMGKPVNVYCVVKKDGNGTNRFYLHEVSDGEGNLLYQLNDDGSVKGDQKSAPSTLQDPSSKQTPSAEGTPSSNSILQDTTEEQGKKEEEKPPEKPVEEQAKRSESQLIRDWKHGVLTDKEFAELYFEDEADRAKFLKNAGVVEETHEDAPQGQAAEESAPVAPTEEKSVKPYVELAEEQVEDEPDDYYDEDIAFLMPNGRNVYMQFNGQTHESAFENISSDKKGIAAGGIRVKAGVGIEIGLDNGPLTAQQEDGLTKIINNFRGDVFHVDIDQEFSDGNIHTVGSISFEGADIDPRKILARIDREIREYQRAVQNNESFTRSAEASNIEESPGWDYPGIVNTDNIEADEIHDYVSQARDGKLIYIEPRSADVGYLYDGEKLYTLDEDGKAVSAKPFSRAEAEKMIFDYTRDYGTLLSLENKHIEFAEGANINGSPGKHQKNNINGARGKNGKTARSASEVLGDDEKTSRAAAEDYARENIGDLSELGSFFKDSDDLIDGGARFCPKADQTEAMNEFERIANEAGIEKVVFYYDSNITPNAVGIYNKNGNILHLVVSTHDPNLTRGGFKHELSHYIISAKKLASKENFQNVCENAFSGINNEQKARNQFNWAFERVRRAYAWSVVTEFNSKYSWDEWDKLGAIEQQKKIDSLPPKIKKALDDSVYEEFICESIAGSYSWFSLDPELMRPWGENIYNYFVNEKKYVDANILAEIDNVKTEFDKPEIIGGKKLMRPSDSGKAEASELDQLKAENEDLKRQLAELQGEKPAKSRPEPDGTRKPHSPNALEQKTQSYGSRVEHYTRMEAIAKKFGTDDGTFLSKTREEVSRIADYCIQEFGADAELERLMNTKDWSRLDFSIAGKIAYDMTKQLNDEMTANGNKGLGKLLERKDGESLYDYQRRQAEEDKREFLRRREPIDALMQMYEQQKSEAGQKLQEQYKFSTADEIRMKASQRLLSYTVDGEVTNASDLAKNTKIYAIINDLLTRAETADSNGDMKEMAEIAKLTAQIRGRENLFGKAGTKAENAIFDDLLKAGFDSDKMAALVYGNIKKTLDDLTPITYLDALNTIRMSNMLSNFATGINNFKNNAVALRLGALAQNAAYPFAKAFEKITGKKIAFTDTSFTRIGSGKMRAEITAYEYALLSSYYGINQERGRFDTRSANAGFNINGEGFGGAFERTLARYNFLINALVLSPDAPAKARAEHAMRQGIERAFEGVNMTKEMAANKKELEAYAHNETLRRTLQDDNRLTNDVLWVKKRLNKYETRGKDIVINGRQLGSLKLGDFVMAFAKVPANVGLQKAMATPFGAFYQMWRYADGLARARLNPDSMSTIEMAKLSRDIGRAATTWGMIGIGALGAMMGALKNFDDTDDDEEKKLAAEKGYKGLTFNISVILRGGGEWRPNDKVVSGSFLEILAMPLAIGAIMYDASQEGVKGPKLLWKGTADGFAGMVDAVMDIPGLQQFAQIYEAYANNRNPDEDLFTKGFKAVGQFAVNSATSYAIPNIVSQFGAGLDNKQRDVYGTDTYGETLRNIVMSKIPFVRTLLPEKTDTLGNTRTYGDNKLMAIINTVLLPGDIKKYNISDLEVEMLRLKESTGYNGTIFDTKAPSKIEFDNEEYALDADNKRAYHDSKAKLLLEAYDKFRNSDVYDTLTDDQKLEVVMQLRLDAERMTRNGALKIAGVDENKLNESLEKWERELTTWDQKIEYLSTKQMIKGVWDESNNVIGDFAAMDKFIKETYPGLPQTTKDLLNNTYGQIDDIYSASKAGIDSKTYSDLKAIHGKYEDMQDYYREVGLDDEPTQTALARNMIVEFEKTVTDPKQRAWAQNNLKLWMHMPVNIQSLEKWQEKTNLETREIDSWFDSKESTPVKGGYKELSQNQRLQMIRDFTGISASSQKELEEKRWKMIEMEASHGDDKDGDGEGDGGAWAKLKPYRDAGYSVAYALEHAVYWYTNDYGKHWQKRSYNKIYPSDK